MATKMNPRLKRSLNVLGAMLLAAGIVGFATARYFRVSSFSDIAAYGGMAAECHPIWKELAFRRLNPGDDFSATLVAMPPDYREILGEYAFYDYGVGFTSLRVYTKDGKVAGAGAGSCTWDYAFFDTLTKTDWDELNRRYDAICAIRYADELAAEDEPDGEMALAESVP